MSVLRALRVKFCKVAVSLFLTVQVANLSIDAVDPTPFDEDLTVNEIESYLELLVEIVCGEADAIRETDEHDHDTHKPLRAFVLYSPATEAVILTRDMQVQEAMFKVEDLPNVKSLSQSVISPPPKQC